MSNQPESILGTLAGLLRQVWPGHPAGPLDPATPFAAAGIGSGHFVVFLTRIEQELGVDWEAVAPPPGALTSLGALADLLSRTPTSA